ncbi:LANO_0D11188g1_1 [Lachancea nothofagi CBS 11611]|uniref:LANO_0D11188g1_1 n=1 Tax=Lachancea nothofagi CBS 11611 TaxID=1266666 RepID=A0A1G4JLP5_9SACH|nr:LANO_0D11188g1_1 [Lachancea nothofagi CBS 11611]
MVQTNKYGQVVGDNVLNCAERKIPQPIVLEGQYCRLEPLNVERHSKDIFEAFSKADVDHLLTYLAVAPFQTLNDYEKVIRNFLNTEHSVHYAIVNGKTGRACGSICLQRIDVQNGAVEIGFVMFSPELQRTVIATEVQYLLLKYVFDGLDYRRCEWKCDALNEPSRNCALRLGFKYEGLFRRSAIYKGRNRDTQWFSIVEDEWPAVRQVFELWLSPENFQDGMQKRKLSNIRERVQCGGT